MTWIDSVYVNMSRCHQFSPMQGTKVHKRSSHACLVKRNWTYELL